MATHHVIVGGGPAATNAMETIRQFDNGQSKITLVSDEPPHSRMALPYWLAGKITRQHTLTGSDEYFRRLGVDARIGVRARQLDPHANRLSLTDGTSLPFDQLLLATGSSPRQTSIPGLGLPGVQPLWTLAQAQDVLSAVEGLRHPRIALVGAGFIGFILLSAMLKRRWRLTVVEREAQVLPRMLDQNAARQVESWLAHRGVGIHCGTTVSEILPGDDGSKIVQLGTDHCLDADLVIIATGIQPNLQLAQQAGIAVDRGILVNDRMQTDRPHIYAGGDVAQGPVLLGEEPAVHAIQPTAVDHGRVAGANMAGQTVHYPGSLLMNVVDVGGLQCASFGNWDDRGAEATTISNSVVSIYRKLLWRGDQMVGAIFVGRADDLGMLGDVGMVKGILQTQTPLGAWKQYLHDNPFDIRRAYVASGVGLRLAQTTLTGRPTQPRQYCFGDARPEAKPSRHHRMYVSAKGR